MPALFPKRGKCVDAQIMVWARAPVLVPKAWIKLCVKPLVLFNLKDKCVAVLIGGLMRMLVPAQKAWIKLRVEKVPALPPVKKGKCVNVPHIVLIKMPASAPRA